MENDKILLPHHVQHKLCETRLPYRQGRKLTAVKVYSIAKESNHLLIFGVPSLKLRQETKAMFMKFGKLLQFHISKEHTVEAFTETYHAQYERIQSARVAKRMLDATNFYGGSLHVCYAPELESIDETRQKLKQRQNDVIRRLKNLQREDTGIKDAIDSNNDCLNLELSKNLDKNLLNMGEVNVIGKGNEVRRKKRNINNDVLKEKRFKPCFVDKSEDTPSDNNVVIDRNEKLASNNVKRSVSDVTEVEVVDCTSVENTTVSNINEALNYNKFGDEVVLKFPTKPVNKIKFNVNKNTLI